MDSLSQYLEDNMNVFVSLYLCRFVCIFICLNYAITLVFWISAHVSLSTEHGDSAPTLTDVMVFLTGCDVPPPLGFGDVEPSVTFSSALSLPTVSTCSLTLTLPLDFPTVSKRRWIL